MANYGPKAKSNLPLFFVQFPYPGMYGYDMVEKKMKK